MRKWLCMLLMFLATGLATAETSAPREVKFGIYILNIGKLDLGSGGFTVDFYLSLISDDPIPDNSFEFLNGRAVNSEMLENKRGGREKFYRIFANLSRPLDLKRFPFDSQKLEILLEDKTEAIEKVRFVPNFKESGLDAGIGLPGWEIRGWTVSAGVHDYPVYDQKFSTASFAVDIGRIKTNSFFKTFVPVLFLMLIVMSSFILNPEQIATRLGAIVPSLVASTIIHLSIANQIPPVGYLTFADKFMVLTYFILLSCFFMSLMVFVLQNRKEEERARRLHHVTKNTALIGIPALYVALFIFAR
jgi:hypothetical protein